MPAYDAVWFEPPAPLALVSLHRPNSQAAHLNVPMLLDSGSEVTLIPTAAATELGASITGTRYELVGFDGNTTFAPVVRLEMRFAHRTFRGQFLLIDQDWGILGRNVLNAVPLLFNGPQLTWDVAQPG
jgi:hypothetical protein